MKIIPDNASPIRRLALLMTAFLYAMLAGCNFADSQNVTYVVITGEPPVNVAGQQFTPLPTAVPPSPTPETPPDVLLQIADRYLVEGYYEDAVATYRAILTRGEVVAADIRAAAAYGMGQAALRSGLFSDAVDAFTTLIAGFPGDLRAARAFFLRGDAYLGLSAWDAAIADFQQYLQLRPGLIDSYVHERIGDGYLALGRLTEALASYGLATDSTRSLVPQLALRERVARVYISAGQVDSAVAQYDAILAIAQNAPYRAEIEYLAAEALLNAGNIEAGLTRMSRIFAQYEAQPQAFQALRVLLEAGIAVNNYARGRVSYFAGDYEGAIEAFNAHTTQAQLETIPAELHLLLGRSYRALGNSQAAQVAFQTIIQQYPDDPLFGDALLEQGRTYFLAGDIDTAIARYIMIADTYSYLEATAAEALWRAGYLHGTNGRPVESRAVFERLADAYPNTEQARSGLFIAASAALSSGDAVGAETLFSHLAATTTGADQAAAYLQVGRLALQRGAQDIARQAFDRARAAAPESYFSARAEDIIAGRAPFTPPAQLHFQFDDVAEITAAEDWLRQTFNLTQPSPLWPLAPQLEADPRMIRAQELWAVGLFDEAEIDFLDVIDDQRADGLASYQLAIALNIVGSYRPSIVAAANVLTAARVSTLQAPAYIARLRYPVYYRDLVLRITQEQGIDPLLMFSLIRHESLFDTTATAAAGEVGLTQVIPGTGEYIARQLNWPDYQHSDLFRPYAGISFGAYYLSEQLNRFDGNATAALAGYNAGPGRAMDWLALSGGDPDLFMATITIESTRIYVQRIYSYYTIYAALYGRAA